ncbi:unnamed protein product [Phytophthora lilii]|uniref:Unnamed protein product n=1 Tax=Phytophthora lilii TaxID=2077276 RepID=A0A9W6TUN0_9STRA|nr:unnamed protein product [Phytophthora lilii]
MKERWVDNVVVAIAIAMDKVLIAELMVEQQECGVRRTEGQVHDVRRQSAGLYAAGDREAACVDASLHVSGRECLLSAPAAGTDPADY